MGRSTLRSVVLSGALGICALTKAGLAVADGVNAPECGASIAQTPYLKSRKLDSTRYDITVQRAGRSSRFELRLDCVRLPLAQVYIQAGFERRPDGWWLSAGANAERADERETATWTGIAATGFQSNVCRSVVGKAKSNAVTFFAEFCSPESDYRRMSKDFDRVELNIVMPASP